MMSSSDNIYILTGVAADKWCGFVRIAESTAVHYVMYGIRVCDTIDARSSIKFVVTITAQIAAWRQAARAPRSS